MKNLRTLLKRHERKLHYGGHVIAVLVLVATHLAAFGLGVGVGVKVQRSFGAVPAPRQAALIHRVAPVTTIGGAYRTPPHVSLERDIVRIHNQGLSESCGCQTESEIVEITAREHGGRKVWYSPGAICAWARSYQGQFGQDAPLSIAALAYAVEHYGVPQYRFSSWDATPGTESFYPSGQAAVNAGLHRFRYVATITDQATLRYYLALGLPVDVLRPIYDSVYSFGSTGLITYNGGGYSHGWHYEPIVAYSHNGAYLDVLNSWGSNYDDGGISHETWNSVTGNGAVLFAIVPGYPFTPKALKPKSVLSGFNMKAWSSGRLYLHKPPISPLYRTHLTKAAAFWAHHHTRLGMGGIVSGPHFVAGHWWHHRWQRPYSVVRFFYGRVEFWPFKGFKLAWTRNR